MDLFDPRSGAAGVQAKLVRHSCRGAGAAAWESFCDHPRPGRRV